MNALLALVISEAVAGIKSLRGRRASYHFCMIAAYCAAGLGLIEYGISLVLKKTILISE